MSYGPEEFLCPANFREHVRRALEVYEKDGRVLDLLFWARIVSFYEAELATVRAELVARANAGLLPVAEYPR